MKFSTNSSPNPPRPTPPIFTRSRMSNNNHEDPLPQTPASNAGDKPPARKRAVKKIAEPATEPVAKKIPAKKAAAKKAAVRKTTAKKTIVKAVVVENPPPPVAPSPPPTADAPRRIGRVPGGGPVASREPLETRVSEVIPSIPFPQPAPPQFTNPAPEQARHEHPPQDGQPRNFQQPDGQPQRHDAGQQTESRSKKRREKRKRKKNDRQQQQPGRAPYPNHKPNANPHHVNRHHRPDGPVFDPDDRRQVQLSGPMIEADGMLELAPKGFGFLRVQKKNFEQARDDVFVTPEIIRKYNLRLGQWIHGLFQDSHRGPQLVEITKINDMTPEEAAKLPHFDELKAINPTRRISFETTPDRYTTRVLDIMAPVGRGQRGLIVSPPRSGKTTLLLHMAEAIREKYDEAIHLMVVLVDERPEEVTEFRRALPGAEIYASSNDEQARNHTRIAELAIERAKRLVEAGKDVFLIMDSITRLARAYNGNMNNRGRGTASGGLTIGALEVPRRLFAAARNTRGGGSLTIMATALIQTNSRADEAIYMEFKGTGNMELVLDRKIAENYIYPAVDIFKSGTRREELLLADHMLHKIHLIRRGLSGHRPAEAMERLLFFQKKFPNNPQMLLEIKG